MANHKGPTYREQWQEAAVVLRKHAAELDELAKKAPPRPQPQGSDMKIAVCEYLLQVNRDHDGPFIPPTAIDWLGNGIVTAIQQLGRSRGGDDG